ncbi:hypothetical protein MRI28_11895 [Nocardiopsis dassonvillei]|uniref:hypothetical protein n=1 Tax=Nocardiopsis dassonvillei TaxID=2014 RepID=UPI00200CDBAE|nr:hypothetical protein [Nocardiopsis dassonvillei]MCK9870333.1 hypothetical protein [Nocardiopsis dassonvillei]
MGSYSVSTSDYFFAEDSPRDVETAFLTGAKAVALLSGLMDPRALAAADLIVGSPHKLQTLLLKGHS